MIEWLGSVRGPVPEDRPQPTWGVMTLGLGTIIINQYLVEHVCEMLRAWRQAFFPREKCFGVHHKHIFERVRAVILLFPFEI